ncbi:MAG: histidine--tRNA ligase [Bacteroidales bacterium]|jgi:histidyl-tRNA synthetase|nr:histidine--tRNA ligase [Bacteroidales bacterium]
MKPTIPKGMRDFSPIEMQRRNYIFDTIKTVFNNHSYIPIETPSMENLSTLMGKYGEEGDRLLFKIINSGDFLANVNLLNATSKTLLPQISDKGLRYDLTVPFARYVVQRKNEITLPFKRYQIQPVWRADRPQKGRYREFYQCDVDIVGSNSLVNEAELVEMCEEVFNSLGISVTVKINNRKILFGVAQAISREDKITDITVAIDKRDKIGSERVAEELMSKGLTRTEIDALYGILLFQGNFEQKIVALKEFLKDSETGLKGVAEIEELFDLMKQMGLQVDYELDLTLARGLNYYTGALFEVKARDVAIGSICGGGRYDELTNIFGVRGVSGVGISFGAERIYDVLLELGAFPERTKHFGTVLFINFGKDDQPFVFPILKKLRSNGISAQLFPDTAKLQKQFSYADSLRIPYVAMYGKNERELGKIMVKNMYDGTQQLLSEEELFSMLINQTDFNDCK